MRGVVVTRWLPYLARLRLTTNGFIDALGGRRIQGKALAKGRPHFYRGLMETAQAKEYLPVLMLALLAAGFGGGMLALSALLGVRGKRNRAKDTAYECGMVPVGEGTTRFSVKFYLVAMLFIL